MATKKLGSVIKEIENFTFFIGPWGREEILVKLSIEYEDIFLKIEYSFDRLHYILMRREWINISLIALNLSYSTCYRYRVIECGQWSGEAGHGCWQDWWHFGNIPKGLWYWLPRYKDSAEIETYRCKNLQGYTEIFVFHPLCIDRKPMK